MDDRAAIDRLKKAHKDIKEQIHKVMAKDKALQELL